uniref:cupin domain-containing protein n=1 Tax=Mesorhizobium sp. WSM4875 TaxID=3038539 RepID=UPI002415F487|nr:cupin domain-containing protein [Mesorhizobium sp. WSM4875]WIE94779.1 cupin domain-containing protein [Mesorhizobium sp. WSM4875]
MTEKINVSEAFSQFEENWRPKVIATLNGQEVKVVKIKGEFPWHFHENDDEFFMVWSGRLRVEFRDRVVEMGPGECVVIPRGVEHRSCADVETEFVIFEPANVLNTGNLGIIDTYTAPNGVAV